MRERFHRGEMEIWYRQAVSYRHKRERSLIQRERGVSYRGREASYRRERHRTGDGERCRAGQRYRAEWECHTGERNDTEREVSYG